MLLAGPETDKNGARIKTSPLLVLFNADRDAVPFHLPRPRKGTYWVRLIDTVHEDGGDEIGVVEPAYQLAERAVVILEARKLPATPPDHRRGLDRRAETAPAEERTDA
jgi:pullulanase/glycogen debranching enzyme